MDWTNIVTAAVAIAGIGSTLLAARMAVTAAKENLQTSISAENDRAAKNEKRRIYARCLTALNDYLSPVLRSQIDGASASIIAERDSASLALANAVDELRLVAPADVTELAEEAAVEVHVLNADALNNPSSTARAVLIAAMRDDLGVAD